MAVRHGKGSVLILDEFDFRQWAKDFSISSPADLADTTTFKDDYKQYFPGLRDATFSVNALYSTRTSTMGATRDELDEFVGGTLSGSDIRFAAGVGQTRREQAIYFGRVKTNQFDIQSPVSDMISASLSFQSVDTWRGLCANPLVSRTSSFNGGNGTDWGAPKTNSRIRFQINCISRTGNATVQLWHRATTSGARTNVGNAITINSDAAMVQDGHRSIGGNTILRYVGCSVTPGTDVTVLVTVAVVPV